MPGWDEEAVFNTGDAFFADLAQALGRAKLSIDLESYIFEPDRFGKRITLLLDAAARKGVRVRLLLDGIGSAAFDPRKFVPELHSGFEVRVFHPFGWAFPRLRAINRRNHRKVCVVDGGCAWLGSMNITEKHLREFTGEAAWRDTGVRISGPPIHWITDAFERTWRKSVPMNPRPNERPGRIPIHRHSRYPAAGEPVRINETLRARRRNSHDIRRRVILAQRRVWVTNAYFVPDLLFLRALCVASRAGVDVRLIVPRKSDVFFMPWAGAMFYYLLLREGVQVYEYRASILHAKTLLIDDWALVGSSNLNQRSLIHDLEVDVVLSSSSARRALEDSFLQDLELSDEIDFETMSRKPWYERWLGKAALLIRYWI